MRSRSRRGERGGRVQHLRHDSDHVSLVVEDRPSRVARLNSSVELGESRISLDAREGVDMAKRRLLFAALERYQRIAQGDDLRPSFESMILAYPQRAPNRVHLEQGEIVLFVESKNLRFDEFVPVE